MENLNKIIQGDSLEVLKTLPSESVDCAITSPPYWALRDYGVAGQLGLEPTFQEYITKLCDIFDEVKRVLKKEGTCWVNLGDSYNNSSWAGDKPNKFEAQTNIGPAKKKHGRGGQIGYPDKCLAQIPSRFAIEMTNRGWILRNEIIWHKPNCMPSSVKDRFTVDFEKVFFFVKNKKYWFDSENVKEDAVDPESYTGRRPRNAGTMAKFDKKNYGFAGSINDDGTLKCGQTYEKRNRRTVWTIATKPFAEAHFATYPEALIEPMIKAGCPEFVCRKCGKAREKIIKLGEIISKGGSDNAKMGQNKSSYVGAEIKCKAMEQREHIEIGQTDCGCNAGFEGGVVMDIFMGAGTTALVAKKLGRNYLGIELNPEYIKIAENRINSIPNSLFSPNIAESSSVSKD